MNVAIVQAHEHMRVDCWPQFWERKDESGSGGRNRGTPWALSILTNLTRSGINLETALNLPEAQAIWLSASSSIAQGATLDILTTEDEALLDELARVEKKPENE